MTAIRASIMDRVLEEQIAPATNLNNANSIPDLREKIDVMVSVETLVRLMELQGDPADGSVLVSEEEVARMRRMVVAELEREAEAIMN